MYVEVSGVPSERERPKLTYLFSMEKRETIISKWLLSKNKVAQHELLSRIGQQIGISGDLPIEVTMQQLAACLMATCAEEMQLTSLELAGLLKTPQQDALSCLVTIINNEN